MISLLRSIQTVNTREGLILSVILMLLGSPLALAQCVDATATTQAELESVILDFNRNCGAGDVLTTTVSGTITISGSAFSPVNNGTTAVLEIVGDGDDALDGGGAIQILDIDDGHVTIDSLTLQNGNVTGGGGAIDIGTNGVLIINNSTLSGNQTNNFGGAIETYGELTITNSLFVNNVSASQASTIQLYDNLTTIENTTFAGNEGIGVIVAAGASANVVMTNSTVSTNVGAGGFAGIVSALGASVTVQNSIFSDNTSGADCATQAGGTISFSSGLSNVIEDDINCGTAGVDYLSVNPLLGALGNNGGNVQTFALMPGSPAINAGDNAAAAGLSTDARGAGFPRIVAGTVDLGAFENQQTAVVEFISGTASDSEAVAAPSLLTLTTSDGNGTVGPIMLEVAVIGGTPAADYNVTSPFTIPAGTASATPFSIPGFAIVDDDIEETDEGLTLTLSNATGATLGAQNTIVYTVLNDDDTPPQVTGRNPNDDDSGVAITVSPEITFNEPVQKAGAGLIQIIETGVGVFESYDLGIPAESARISVSGSVVTIDPTVDFAELTDYHVLISAGAISNLTGTGFAGYSMDTEYNFTTDDATPPQLTTLAPADNATNVNVDISGTLDLQVAFNEQVGAGSGFISLYRSADNFLVETIDIQNAGRVSFFLNSPTDGGFFVDLQAGLDEVTEYYVQIDPGAVIDAANNPNSFPGITDTTTWTFITGDYTGPTLAALDPMDDAGGVPLNPVLMAMFDEPIGTGAGNIALYSGSPQVLFHDPLDNASLLNVTQGNFFADADAAFAPDAIFGVNDGMGGGDFGGDTPGDRVTYNGFTGGFLEANGLNFGGTNPVVVEWQNIDITGAMGLELNLDLASALQPDTNDFVVVEAIVDGGIPIDVLTVFSPALNSVFRTADSGTLLNDTTQTFRRPIPVTGASLTLRATLSLSGTSSSGDDIAIDNVMIIGNGVGSSTLVEQVTAVDSNVMILGDTLAFDPTASLNLLTDYYVTMEAGAVTDTSPNANPVADILTTDWNFTTTGDATPPSLVALAPADNATNIGIDTDMNLTFSESVLAGAGNITIHLSSDDSIVETIAIGASNVTIVGDTVTVDPAVTLLESTDYHIQVDAGAITDQSANAFVGITDSTTWNFTTGDFSAPVLISLSPADDTMDVDINTDLALAFDESVQAGTGDITLHLSSDDSVVEAIAAGSAAVTAVGNTVTIDPAVTLAETTEYYVRIAAGAMTDTSPNANAFSGVNDSTSWSFTTGEFTAPVVVSLTPTNGATNVATDTDLAVVFDESVQAGTGDVTIHRASDDSVVETVPIGAANVVFAGNTVTIDPAVTLAESSGYYVHIDAGAILDSFVNPFPGIADSTSWAFTTGDFTPPNLVAINPADDATDVATNTSLQMVFDEAVQAGAGTLSLHRSSDDSVVESLAIGSPGVTIVGDTVTIAPATTLAETTEHYVLVTAGAITDTSPNANAFAGIADTMRWSFTTGEFTAPVVVSLTPANGATDVAIDADLVMVFDENVQAGTGDVTIHLSSDDSVVETISIGSPAVQLLGDTVTINPSIALAESTDYYVQVAAGAITDTALNAFPGISGNTSWSVTTGDFTAPALVALSPADEAVDVATNANLEMTFDEDVQAGTGNLSIHRSSDNSLVETIAVGSGSVTFAGDSVTIDPVASLANTTQYYVQVQATAIADASDNAFVGIGDTQTWNFTTGDFVAPEIVTLDPATGSADVASDVSLTITFDKTIQAGSGAITLYDASDDRVFQAITVPSAQVVTAGDEVRIDPGADMELGTTYYVQISDGAITDTATTPNAFAGINNSTTWRFTIDDNDGVANDIEDQAPNGGDGNNDGIPDRLQPHVASFPSQTNGCFLTIATPTGTLISNPGTSAVPPDAPASFQYPCHLVEFELTGVSAVDQTDLELFVFPGNPAVGAFFTFNHQSNAWENVATGIDTMGSTRIQRNLTDGGPYDADGVADGVIRDLGAPAIFVTDSARPVPILPPWGLLILGLIFIVAAQRRLRRS